MEYHYFTIEDVEMLKFNGITHLLVLCQEKGLIK